MLPVTAGNFHGMGVLSNHHKYNVCNFRHNLKTSSKQQKEASVMMQLEACIVEIVSEKTASSSNTRHGGYSSEGATARDEDNNMHHIIT